MRVARCVQVMVAAIGLAAGAVAAQEQPATPPQPTPAQSPVAQPAPSAPQPATGTPVAPNPAPAAPAVTLPNPSEPEAQPGDAREAIVTLKDGQRYTGLLVSRDTDKVVLKISGIDTAIPAAHVDRINVLPPTLDRYRSMRAAIDDNDVERLLMLAEWLRARSQWDTALTEIDHVLQVQPDNAEAKRLKMLVKSQKDLAERAGSGKARKAITVAPSAAPAQNSPTEPAAGGAFPVLSDADINTIKVYEVDLSIPPRLVIGHETIKRLIEQHQGDPLIPNTPDGREAMYRMSAARILDIMFKVQARELYPQVRVVDEPHSMRLFRENVHRTWLMNSCATTRCHGGSEAGRLALNNQKASSDAAIYTNFLIMDRFKLSDGKPLINYDDPAESALLQLGLPREASTYPHPQVPGTDGRGDLWRPVFKSRDDSRFKQAVEWIKAMYRPRPPYPVQYTPPSPQPVPQQAGGAPVER